jgi:hypothetical protein
MFNGDNHTVNLPTIGQNQMAAISVFDAGTYNPTTNPGRVGSMSVTSSQAMAGVVLESDCTGSTAVVLNGTRGFTSADFDDTAYAPVIKNNRFGQFTGMVVQNVSGGSINVTVDYRGVAGACAGNTYQDTATGVANGAAASFVHTGASTNLPTNCVASATISATGDFVALVNEQELAGFPKVGITYNAIADGAATPKANVPLFKSDRFGFSTGLQIQNVGASPATNWSATFVCSGGASFTAVSDVSKTGPIGAGQAFLFYRPHLQNYFTGANPFSASNVNCSVTIQGDQNLVAIANEAPLTAGNLDNNNYVAFNTAP